MLINTKTPLVEKLGLKAGQRVLILGAPQNFVQTLEPLPANIQLHESLNGNFDFIHCFVTKELDVADLMPQLAKSLSTAGSLWMSWPQRISRIPTDLNEDRINAIGLLYGLVDVKFCAINQHWFGVKLKRHG